MRAEYAVDHPHRVAFATVDQLANELGINPSTIVRFAYRLGMKGFPELQERMRQLVRGQLSQASRVVDENSALSHLDGTIFGASLANDLQNIHRTIASLTAADLDRAVALLIGAGRIFVTGAFAAYSVAHYLALALDRMRGNTVAWSPDTGLWASQSMEISDRDCVVAFTFPPYAVATHRVTEWAKEAGAKVIAVTDTPISTVGRLADLVLPAAAAGTGMQNSLIAAIAVANALLNGVAAADGQSALERYARLNRLMNRWEVFLLRGDETE